LSSGTTCGLILPSKMAAVKRALVDRFQAITGDRKPGYAGGFEGGPFAILTLACAMVLQMDVISYDGSPLNSCTTISLQFPTT
jgi:hypothetical protein